MFLVSYCKTFKHYCVICSMSSKKTNKSKLGKTKFASISKTCNPELPVTLDDKGNVRIKIAAKPGAKISAVTGIHEEGVGVQISAPPVEGQANTELVKYLASCLGLKKSCVSLERASKSRQKVILISGCNLSVEQIVDKLKDNIDN